MAENFKQKTFISLFFNGLIPQKRNHRYIFALTIFCAFFLRFIGIGWGLPKERFELSLYETETETLEYILSLDPLRGDFDPDTHRPLIYNLLIGRLVLTVGGAMGFCELNNDMKYYQRNPAQLRKCFLALRFWNLLLGVSGLILIFGIGRAAGGSKTGLLAMAIATVTPIHITESHFYTHQLRISTYLALVIYLTFMAIKNKSSSFQIATAVAAGLTGGVLINGLFSFVAIPILLLFEKGKHKSLFNALFSKNSLRLYFAFFFFFILAIGPQWKHSSMFLKQFDHIKYIEVFYRYPEMVDGWHTLLYTFPFAFGAAIYAAGIFGIIRAAIKRRGPDKILLGFFLPFFFLILIFSVSRARYALHILPMISVISALAIIDAAAKFGSKIGPTVLVVLISIVMGFSLLFSSAFLGLLAKGNHVPQANVWMEKNIPAQESIALVSEYRRGLPSILDKGYFGPDKVYFSNIKSLEKDYDFHLPDDLDWVITFDFELFGIYKKYLFAPKLFPKKGKIARRLLAGKYYREVAVFRSEPWLFKNYLSHVNRPMDLSFGLYAIRVFQKAESGSLESPGDI